MMASPPHEKLTRREREIMDAIFAFGDSTSAEDIRTPEPDSADERSLENLRDYIPGSD